MRCIPFGMLILSLICLFHGQRSAAGENADASDSSSQIAAAANSYAAAFNAPQCREIGRSLVSRGSLHEPIDGRGSRRARSDPS